MLRYDNLVVTYRRDITAFPTYDTAFGESNLLARFFHSTITVFAASAVGCPRILATSNNISLDVLAELANSVLDTAPSMIQATT